MNGVRLSSALVLTGVLAGGFALTGCAAKDRPLQLVSGAGPVFPEQARADGIEGRVVVRYDVDLEGIVRNARVVLSEPPGVFDAAALAAVRSWRFNPPVRDGERVPARNRESEVAFRQGDTSAYDSY